MAKTNQHNSSSDFMRTPTPMAPSLPYGGFIPTPPTPMMPSPPGTVLKVYIPAGAVINLLNILEVTSPQGISLIVRVPLLGGSMGLHNLMASVVNAGGTVQQIDGSNYNNLNYYQPYFY